MKTQIRICEACGTKERKIQRIARASIIIGLFVAVAVGIHFDLGNGGIGFLGAALALPGILVSQRVGKPVRVGDYDDETVEFCFKSTEYANEFKALNQA